MADSARETCKVVRKLTNAAEDEVAITIGVVYPVRWTTRDKRQAQDMVQEHVTALVELAELIGERSQPRLVDLADMIGDATISQPRPVQS